MGRSGNRNENGFTLLEALIAASLIGVVVIGLAHVVTMSSEQSIRARRALVAVTLAQSKLEHLRAVPWDFDAGGVRVSSNELTPSPLNALEQDSPPHVEGLDRFGAPVALGDPPTYVRRWSIEPVDPADTDTLVLSVCVFSALHLNTASAEACVWATRTRRP